MDDCIDDGDLLDLLLFEDGDALQGAVESALVPPQPLPEPRAAVRDGADDEEAKKRRRRAQYARAARKSRDKHRTEFENLKQAIAALRVERDQLLERLRRVESSVAADERELGTSAARQQSLFARAVHVVLAQPPLTASEDAALLSFQTMDFARERLNLVWERRLSASEHWSQATIVACEYPGAGMTVRFSNRPSAERFYWYEFMFLSPFKFGRSGDAMARFARDSIVSVWTNRDSLYGACPMAASNVAEREIVSLPGFSVLPSATQTRRLDAWLIRERVHDSPSVVEWMYLVSCDEGAQACAKASLWSGYAAERTLAESVPPSTDRTALINEALDQRADHGSMVKVFSAYRTSFRQAVPSTNVNLLDLAAGDHDLAQGLRVWSELVTLRGEEEPRTLTHAVVLSLEGSNVDLAHMGGKYGLVDEQGHVTSAMHQVGRGFMEIMFRE